jgi:uracil-DNA glycosylase family 4
MLVGEAPSFADDKEGLPFSGKVGKILYECLQEAEADLEELIMVCTVGCRLPSRKPTHQEVKTCTHNYLHQYIAEAKPEVVIALGATAANAIFGKVTPISSNRGKMVMREIEGHSFSAFVTYHPAYLIRNEFQKETMVADLRTACGYSEIGEEAHQKAKNYYFINSAEDLTQWRDYLLEEHKAGKLQYGAIGVDIETCDFTPKGEVFIPQPGNPKVQIASIQVAWGDRDAVLIPLVREDSAFSNPLNTPVLKKVMQEIFDKIPVVGHNFVFDASYFHFKLGSTLPRMQIKKGLDSPGVVFDTMLAFHFLSGGDKSAALDNLIPLFLGETSHKGIIADALSKLMGNDRHYGNLPHDLLLRYGCDDATSTLRLYGIFRVLLAKINYQQFPGRGVVFKDGLSAFLEVVMHPWHAVLSWAVTGMSVDPTRFKPVQDDLADQMHLLYEKIESSPYIKGWKEKNTVVNPRRIKRKKEFRHKGTCTSCGRIYLFPPPRPKRFMCDDCQGEKAVWGRKMIDGEGYEVNYMEPEMLVPDFNPNSPNQKVDLFYNVIGFPAFDHPKHGKDSKSSDKVAREIMLRMCIQKGGPWQQIARPLIDVLDAYGALSKLFTSYAVKLPQFIYEEGPQQHPAYAKVGRPNPPHIIRCSFKQSGTETGRLSTSGPSLHTIPKKSVLKTVFNSRFGEYGIILQVDYSQFEVRVFVIESGDPSLKKAFIEGMDPHKATASTAYSVSMEAVTDDLRSQAKTILFGLLYGRGPTAIGVQINKSKEEAQALIDGWFKNAPKVKAWIDHTHKQALQNHAVVSKVGRIRRLDEWFAASDDKGSIAGGLRRSVNTPVQGLAGDLCTRAGATATYMLQDAELKSMALLTVHDSLVLDVHISELFQVLPIVRYAMVEELQNRFKFVNVPLDIDIELGCNWGQLTKVAGFTEDSLSLSMEKPRMDVISDVLGRISKQHALTPGARTDKVWPFYLSKKPEVTMI